VFVDIFKKSLTSNSYLHGQGPPSFQLTAKLPEKNCWAKLRCGMMLLRASGDHYPMDTRHAADESTAL
jgi:hypothetical protein